MTALDTTIERSNLLRADVAEHPDRYRVLTGERPTSPLHLGHYFGTLAERVRLHDLGVDTVIILADYQVIADRDAIGQVRDNVYSAVPGDRYSRYAGPGCGLCQVPERGVERGIRPRIW